MRVEIKDTMDSRLQFIFEDLLLELHGSVERAEQITRTGLKLWLKQA